MTDQTNTPELRFPEFNTDWTTNQAKNLFTNVSDKKHDGDLLVLSATQDKGMVPRQDLDLEIKYDIKNLSNYKRTLPNDFIISLRSFQGGFELNTIEGIVSPAYTVLRGEEELVQPKFFKQYFKSIRFIKKLDSMIYGIRDGKSISYKEFSTFSINYPSILEQQKIGNFFSKLDHQIELEEKKLELLEQQKRGYMQKLFSQELRFKDYNGNEYPNWEVKKLQEIIEVKDGTHESPKPIDKGYLLVTSKNLKNNKLDFSESYNISKEDYENINKRSKVEIGDILFGMIGTIGNPILLKEEGFAIKNVALLKTNNLQEKYFILNFLKSIAIAKQFHKMNAGGTQKFISLGTIRDLKIDIPSPEEAIKIGDFLNKIDELIENQSKKIDFLKQRKKGLLQKMFV